MADLTVETAAPCGPDSVALAEPASAVGRPDLLTDPDSMEAYRRDWAKDPRVGMPCAVLCPRAAEQVQEAMRWATRTHTSVVPRERAAAYPGARRRWTGR